MAGGTRWKTHLVVFDTGGCGQGCPTVHDLYTVYKEPLRGLGYDIKPGEYLALRPEVKERFVRLKTLGDDYTEDPSRAVF